MSIVNEILYLTNKYRQSYNQAPTVLLINNDKYRTLCEELNKENLDNIYGMLITITKDVDLDIQY